MTDNKRELLEITARSIKNLNENTTWPLDLEETSDRIRGIYALLEHILKIVLEDEND